MTITRVSAFQVDLSLADGPYNWWGGNTVSVLDSTLVRLDTDGGVSGHGEVCPLGPAYLPAHAEGARTGLAEIGPRLLGLDPTRLGVIDGAMNAALEGHAYVRSPVDVACWDILGQAAYLPVCELLGGRHGPDFGLYRAISQDGPAEMAARIDAYRGTAEHPPRRVGGRLAAPGAPGLGLAPRPDVLGEPVLVVE